MRFKNILVHSNVQYPSDQKTIEDSVVQKLESIGVKASPSYGVFLPGFHYNWAQKKAAILSFGFDSALLIQIIDSNVSQKAVTDTVPVLQHPIEVHMPLVSDPNHERPRPGPEGPKNGDEGKEEHNQQGNDHHQDLELDFVERVKNFSVAHFKIQTKLVDTSDFKAVWVAQTGSRESREGEGEISLGTIMDSYAGAIVRELENEGIVAGTIDQRTVSP